MTALHEIQASFLHDIYTGQQTSAVYLDKKKDSVARLRIYNRNVIFGLSDILANAYPVVKKLVGDGFFQSMARLYLQSHPQSLGNRHMFGADLSGFIQNYQPAQSLPYLSDVAAFEWAYLQASIADDAPRLDFEMLMNNLQNTQNFVLHLLDM